MCAILYSTYFEYYSKLFTYEYKEPYTPMQKYALNFYTPTSQEGLYLGNLDLPDLPYSQIVRIKLR